MINSSQIVGGIMAFIDYSRSSMIKIYNQRIIVMEFLNFSLKAMTTTLKIISSNMVSLFFYYLP